MGGVLAMIAHLYEVEQVSRRNGLHGEELRLAREHGARPMLNQLHEYLLAIREQVLPKSQAGQAVAYTLKNWTALTRYCSDGDLSIDNNPRNGRCGASRWAATIGPFSAATTAARLRPFCAASFLPANL